MGNITDVISYLGSNWIIVAFMAPMFWALVNIIDVYFVGGVYKDEFDGIIISSLFQMLPWPILAFFIDLNISPYVGFSKDGVFHFEPALLLLFLGGVLFSISTYFYFKALFGENDVALLQIIWNLAAVFVPIMALLFFGERLGYYKYLGILVVLIGATILSTNSQMKLKLSRKYMAMMFGGVFFLSLGMVLEERAYSILGVESLGSNGFWTGYLFFSLGFLSYGLVVMFWKKRNVFPLIQKYFAIFLLAETLSFLGILASQRAIDISPSVSYVATVQTFGPFFIIFFSFIILGYLYLFRKKDGIFETIYNEQIDGIWIKIASVVFMAWGVYMISF